jgi:ketosteroid isomerase-like protein
MAQPTSIPGTQEAIDAAERLYQAWADAFANKDLEAVLALYAPNATLESPLVNTLLKTERGVVEGRDDLRHFFGIIISSTPALRNRHRESFFTDGRTMIWEYPRLTPSGEQTEMAEVMKIENGLIRHHRIYWGWGGTKLLQGDRYRA